MRCLSGSAQNDIVISLSQWFIPKVSLLSWGELQDAGSVLPALQYSASLKYSGVMISNLTEPLLTGLFLTAPFTLRERTYRAEH